MQSCNISPVSDYQFFTPNEGNSLVSYEIKALCNSEKGAREQNVLSDDGESIESEFEVQNWQYEKPSAKKVKIDPAPKP